MPRVYERTFHIRHYECDASGKVNPANYLRFLQEAAYAASADAGYDMVGYRSLGSLWFIRETEIAFDYPLQYGDEVKVCTWVEDFHRVRSVRAYEVFRGDASASSARAWSDWVYLDVETGMPASIPAEMIAAFIPNAAERSVHPRRRFKAAVCPPFGVFTCLRRVEWRDQDPIRHVNNAVYYSYIEECGRLADQALDWPAERMAQAGVSQVVRKMHIEYRQPAVYPDQLEISTWITGIQPDTILRYFAIRRQQDGELLCQANLDFGWETLDTGDPALAPAEWLEDVKRVHTEVFYE